MRKDIAHAILLIILTLGLSITTFAGQQVHEFRGPIILSIDENVVFQDIGSGRVWEVTEPFGPTMWSSDGCKLLGQLPDQRWGILTLGDMNIRELPQQPTIQSPFWGPDSQSITYTSYPANGMWPVTIYSLDLENHEIASMLSFNEAASAIKWLSDTTLLYSVQGELRVWDMNTEQSQRFGTIHYPAYLHTRFYSILEHR